ncbi:Aste57867_15761 [Aphanomyces stellatus]|uniref:Aste57867_1048 protein n=1 Tax=Aphanomyces stellatus TaxID=120398 RepID=A0A485L465_9STRA|nr:hypothetical protein As57867_015705 [Aphanomyces stellatus]KAF0719452.1 hypothetical protein As57867_001047 [Aphanomyces stellatus]VFT78270.1 Aste57867_1048 [Aphanomyces stellatus]VFT92550.1 Aste57867_15761 [Aphanomyces stellatus]
MSPLLSSPEQTTHPKNTPSVACTAAPDEQVSTAPANNTQVEPTGRRAKSQDVPTVRNEAGFASAMAGPSAAERTLVATPPSPKVCARPMAAGLDARRLAATRAAKVGAYVEPMAAASAAVMRDARKAFNVEANVRPTPAFACVLWLGATAQIAAVGFVKVTVEYVSVLQLAAGGFAMR